MFSKILIANRGEIAVRILRACRELGISTVAVYSEVDRGALHVRLADEAVLIGPAPASESYLSIERLLEAAKRTGAEAIHPGYGFLSENASFAQAVEEAGFVFIGPSPSAILAMGDKAEARQRMQSSGVPVVPGYQVENDLSGLEAAAGELGFPLLVKAAAGGGGKGMRVVQAPHELRDALASARREAERSFGTGRLILERYFPQARHIEFQILADERGKVLHLFERECSIQRRHQKVIEESPSPYLNDDLRTEMGAAATAAAKAVGYRNAGTVEFIVDPETGGFFFLEMNTRLQVEHPITELVTGIDLVHWQIRIAAGEHLPFTQEDLQQRGHALECRLYAEDPAAGFLPASGKILRFIPPAGPGVRVDTGVTSGDEITLYYDPLIAKVITYAHDRKETIQRMQTALRESVLLGIPSNWRFLQDLLADPDFLTGNIHTTWVEERFQRWEPPDCPLPPEVLIAAALTQFSPDSSRAPLAAPGVDTKDRYSPWAASSSFRPGE